MDTARYVGDNRRETVMICPIWRDLQARFVGATKAIEENDERLPGGHEWNRQLNAAARAAAQELFQHEKEHGCKPNRDEVVMESRRRREEAVRRIREGKGGSDS